MAAAFFGLVMGLAGALAAAFLIFEASLLQLIFLKIQTFNMDKELND
ncbi:hypothetical protein OAA47_02300 [Methylophilaceae bacterium]|nr:hypothetical protein [Methylophilaceae bacterium]